MVVFGRNINCKVGQRNPLKMMRAGDDNCSLALQFSIISIIFLLLLESQEKITKFCEFSAIKGTLRLAN
jgi:hypothetical protein